MFPSGIIALFSILLLIRPPLFFNSISLKHFILTVFLLKIDYFIYRILFRHIDQSFIFHSIFTGVIIFILIKMVSSFKDLKIKTSISKSFILAFGVSVITSMLLGLVPINHFWPIPDSDLNFSLIAELAFSDLSSEFIDISYLLLEFIFLFFYGKALVLKIASNKGSALDIKRISRSINIQKYLFIALLFIFFVSYLMNLANFQPLFTLSYICYLTAITANIYTTYKTDFNYVG